MVRNWVLSVAVVGVAAMAVDGSSVFVAKERVMLRNTGAC